MNLVLLFCIRLLGYATAMLAFDYDLVIGVVIYAATLGLIGAANTRHLFVSIPVAVLSPAAGILTWLAIPLINVVLRLWGRMLPSPVPPNAE